MKKSPRLSKIWGATPLAIHPYKTNLQSQGFDHFIHMEVMAILGILPTMTLVYPIHRNPVLHRYKDVTY